MASKSYTIGRRFEYRVRDHLTELGYLVVRSPQSRGPYDLIAISWGIVLLIQCKVDGRLNPAGWNELFDVCEMVDAVPVCVFRSGRKLKWRRLLKRKNGLHRSQPWCEIFIHANTTRALPPASPPDSARRSRARSLEVPMS